MAGPQAPLFAGPGTDGADRAVDRFLAAVPADRITLGMPYHTRGWREVAGGDDGLCSRSTAPADARGPGGDLDLWGGGAEGFNPLWHALALPGFRRRYDPATRSSWLWNPDTRTFLSIEDERSTAARADYVVERRLGGVMAWELAGDYAQSSGGYRPGPGLTALLHRRFTA